MNRDEKIALIKGARVEGALHDCHVKGLSSIWLSDKVRMFLADYHHELWRNATSGGQQKMSLGFHPHRYDVTLIPLFGNVLNISIERLDATLGDGWLDEYEYRSVIINGESAIVPTGHRNLRPTGCRYTLLTDAIAMSADDLHTVSVPRHTAAAWVVVEGELDPNYSPVLYTNNPVFDATEIYRPMQADQVAATIDFVLRMMP